MKHPRYTADKSEVNFCRRDCSQLLSASEFWADHTGLVTCGPSVREDTDFTESAFGISEDEMKSFHISTSLYSDFEFSYFPVHLPGGYSVYVEHINDPNDFEIEYYMDCSSWETDLKIGCGTARWLLPVFRWEELILISTKGRIDNPHVDPFAAALLLLYPSVWLTVEDNLKEVCAVIKRAWLSLGVIRGSGLSDLVDFMVTSAFNRDIHWYEDRELGWINNGSRSLRNPVLSHSLLREKMMELKKFFSLLSASGY